MDEEALKNHLERHYAPDFVAETFNRVAGEEYKSLELIVENSALLKIAGVGFGIVSGLLLYVSPLKAHPAQFAFSSLCALYGFRDSRKYGAELEKRNLERKQLYFEMQSEKHTLPL
jgi:hypothetical protein